MPARARGSANVKDVSDITTRSAEPQNRPDRPDRPDPTHAPPRPGRAPIDVAPVQSDPTRRLLTPGQTIQSPETMLSYRIERLLGQGGFGQVYLARRQGPSSIVAETVCIKVSGRIDGWLRE